MVYRNATSPTNERSLLVAVIPKGTACHNALRTMRPFEIHPSEEDLSEKDLHGMYTRIFTDSELFCVSGLLNSIAVDYLIRSKVEENINMFHLLGTQVPKLTDGDQWFNYVSERAARLNCYGDSFEETRKRLGGVDPLEEEEERREARAEIDAAVFHAYGLTEEESKFILNDFHLVQEPRMMDQDYLDMVIHKYCHLDDQT